jgi:hypothetical protein
MTRPAVKTMPLLAGVLLSWGCREARPCDVADTVVEVRTGSELHAHPEARLRLEPGELAGCESSDVTLLLQQLQSALRAFPIPLERLRVHLDPRLPEGHARLRKIEVHVGSREVLLETKALPDLSTFVWHHELCHVVAQPPPDKTVARRVRLTIDEALADQVAARLAVAGERATDVRLPPSADLLGSTHSSLAWELLGEPRYDPHVLAPALAQELQQLGDLLDAEASLQCLGARQSSAAETSSKVREVAQAVVDRCPADVRDAMRGALGRWLPVELSPFASSTSARAVPTVHK